MFYSNAHTHSDWCDGENTLAEMAQAAEKLGFTDLGFTSHSPAPFDPTCLGVKDESAYQKAVRSLAEKSLLQISCGLEWDYFSKTPISGYDYFVGSVHYLPPRAGVYRSVDDTPENFAKTLQEWYDGDFLALAQDYYDLVVTHITQNQPKIVGHFDLVTKFNDTLQYLTAKNQDAYEQLALTALKKVVAVIQKYDGLVEVNTGGMSRGWTKQAYPAKFLLNYLASEEVPIIITSDTHQVDTLAYAFEETKKILQSVGFSSSWQLKKRKFVPVAF